MKKIKDFPSNSTKGKFYTVQEKDGILSCNCPPWIFNRNGNRTCKHTEICRKELGFTLPPSIAKTSKTKPQYYKEVFVGQLWKDTENGEPDIKVLEIGKGLQDKYSDLCFTDAQHGLNEGVDVLYSMDGDKQIDDYIQFMDYTYSNCYGPTKRAPKSTGNFEPEYKREEDEE